MPSGYTSLIQNGQAKTFKDFAYACTRAFGACYSLRDRSLSIDFPVLPEDDEIFDYSKKLDEAINDFLIFDQLNEDEKHDQYILYIKSSLKFYENQLEEKKKLLSKYQFFLDKAKQFNPPTDDHIAYKDFLIQQLKETISFDCDINYYQNEIDRLKNLDFNDWVKVKYETLNNAINTYTELNHKNKDKGKSSQEWLNCIKETLEKNPDFSEICP